MKKFQVLCLLFVAAATVLWGGGAKESAASSTYGKYAAGQGIILPPEKVFIDSYIASIDYSYPKPEKGAGITMYAGHRQVSAGGQEEVIQIGIQAAEMAFKDLPPMNLSFVIDKSGSMTSANKMDWVKEAFDIFIERVRDLDFVSLVVFDGTAKVLFPSTRMDRREKRLEFKERVHSITPDDGTNLAAGLELGYQQVLANYRTEYTNRVLFLTDGVGEAKGILDMAAAYAAMGINVSTIGVGTDFDVKLMTDLALKGGGSSRFISDRKEMEKTFGSELDRMVVPAVKDLAMTLTLAEGMELLGTWGYENTVSGNTVRYALPTLHHRDYETILAQVRIPASQETGTKTLATFTATYSGSDGKPRTLGPYVLKAEAVAMESPVAGFSDGMVLKSGTMLHLAQALQTIGRRYADYQADLKRLNALRGDQWQKERNAGRTVSYEDATNGQIAALEKTSSSSLRSIVDLAQETKKELSNARLRLDNTGFDDEIGILEDYLKILGKDLRMSVEETGRIVADVEVKPPVSERSLADHVAGLLREMTLSLQGMKTGTVAISGFSTRQGTDSAFLGFLNEAAVTELARSGTLRVVERSKLDAVLKEQELALSDLMDASKAITIGRILTASHVLTGSVIEMPGSVVVFGRILDVETAEVLCASQVLIPKSAGIAAMLSPKP